MDTAKQPSKAYPAAGWILFAICILGVMIQIDFTAVNVALIAIGHTINADLSAVQWALSAYVLAWGAVVLTAGRCADLFGRRRIFLIGTVLFMIGSALTGAAHQAWFLIFGRVVQGIGGALFLPGLYTMVFTAFPENRRGFALGVLSAAISIGMAIGPTFGGVVLQLLNWRWIFFLNIPLGFPVIGIILWAVQREPWRLSDESMDYVGACLIAISLVIFMVALNQVNSLNVGQFWGAIVAAVLLAAAFIVYERRQQYPLVQLEMFNNPAYLGCVLSYVILGYAFSTVMIVGVLYLQNALDYSAFHTGFIFLTCTAMFALVSVFGGKLVDHMDARIPIIIGSVATAASLFTFAFCTQFSSLWLPMLALALFGAGGGLGFPSLNATMMKSIPQNLLSTASSAFAMFGLIGNTFGLILSSIWITTFGQRKLDILMTQQSWQLNLAQISQLHEIIGSTHYQATQLKGFPVSAVEPLLTNLRAAFVHGMFISMLVTLVLILIGIFISATMIRGILPTTTKV